MALLARFFGRTASEGAAYAFGVATGPVLAPATEEIRQAAWRLHQARLPDVAALAAGVAQGKVDEGTARDWAQNHGYGDTSFTALVNIATTAPDVALAMRALRRDKITPAEFTTVLERHGIAKRWNAAILALRAELLDPSQLAAAIHRGLIPDPGLLRGEQPTGPFKVEAYPVYPIDADLEAEASGYDHERLGVLVGLQGLPMGTHEAAQAFFRGVITHGDYVRAFNESNSRNEWAQAVLDQSRQIPTARDFLENALRGYRPLASALEGAALHGMTPEHATLIYQNQGRPLPVRLINQALARGGKFKPEPGEITDPYDASIVEGNLKPAYYDLAKSLRYVMPSAFAIRQLVQSGVWSAAKAAERLKWSGWLPEDADEVAAAWAGGAAATTDGHVEKARTQLWGTTHRSYIATEISASVARNRLQQLGIAAQARNQIMDLWDAERELIRKQLTPAQIKKAFVKATKNYATNRAWTRDEAIAALVARGYSVNEANDFLDIPSGS